MNKNNGILILILSLVLAPCAAESKRAPEPVPAAYLYKGSYVNIRVPNSEGWDLVRSSTTGMRFTRSWAEQNETFVADLTIFSLPEIRNNNEFLSFIKKGFKVDTDHPRFEIVEADFVLTEKRSYPCVRADSILRDKHAQTSSSQRETQLLQLGNLHCRHPVRKNTFFSISYSHRGRSLYSNFNTEAQGFIDGVQVPGH